jgi:hypothetical protein
MNYIMERVSVNELEITLVGVAYHRAPLSQTEEA